MYTLTLVRIAGLDMEKIADKYGIWLEDSKLIFVKFRGPKSRFEKLVKEIWNDEKLINNLIPIANVANLG